MQGGHHRSPKEGRKEVEVTMKKEREIGPAIKSLNYYSIREIEHTIDRLLQNMEREVTPHESNPKIQFQIISNRTQNPFIYFMLIQAARWAI